MKPETQPAIFISVLTLACLLVILAAIRKYLLLAYPAEKATRKFTIAAIIIIAWMVLISILASQGILNDFSGMPPRPVLTILVPVVILGILIFSGRFDKMLVLVPVHLIIAFQAFRILVEIMLWMGHKKGLIPVQMTFEGRNFDIITGLLAIPVAIILKKRLSRTWVIVFNVIGIALLTNVLTVAVLSMPTSFRYFKEGPAVDIVGKFPFVFLPGFLVVLAITLHFLSLRRLYLYTKK